MPDGCMSRHAYEPKHIGIFFLNCHAHYTESREKKYGFDKSKESTPYA